MDFYYVEDDYIKYLRQYDQKVADNKHETRPYVGIVLTVNGIEYFAPFTSPKQKHLSMKNDVDFRKINGGKLGAINLNNMIPVVPSALIKITISAIADVKYRRLMQNQYNEIRKDSAFIQNSAIKLRSLIFADDTKLSQHDLRIKSRCCDLALLEKIYNQYQNR